MTPAARVVLEKPIGRDLDSARAINAQVGAVFAKSQIYRIDHYLGKETVQNLLALRFANSLFEPLWNANHIDHVQITVAETVGVEGRGDYYDHSGALRDMVQNHLLQLVCLVGMKSPVSLAQEAVRDEKLKVLRSLKPMGVEDVGACTVRGQYRAGAVTGGAVPAYADEPGIPAGSGTETFVALKLEIANWRWAGVPFYLRTGKRLPAKMSEIVIQFRPIPHSIFPQSAGELQANRLIVRLQPDESIRLHLMAKEPGPGGMRLRQAPLKSQLRRNLWLPFPRRLRAAVDGRRAWQPDAVHAPRRGGSRLGLGGNHPGRLEVPPRPAQTLHLWNLGAVAGHRPDRTRRSHLARG